MTDDIYFAFDRDEEGNPINVRSIKAEPVWEGGRIVGYRDVTPRVPGTCPYCGVMQPFPHDVTCPRARR